MTDTDAPPHVTVREWVDVVRRARLGRTVKAIALTVATYADFDSGRRCRPGIARLAIEAEVTYKTARQSLGKLRDVGLIELVRRSRGRGDADEYRLTLGEQVLDEVDVLSPPELARAAEMMRDAHRRKRPAGGRGPDDDGPVRGMPSPVSESGDEPVRGTAPPVLPVDNPAVQGTARPVPADHVDSGTGHGTSRTDGCTGYGTSAVRGTPCPTTTQGPHTTPTPHTHPDVDPSHQTAREQGSKTIERNSSISAARCPHGFAIRRRPDGTPTCALCRRDARTAAPAVDRPPLRIVRPA